MSHFALSFRMWTAAVCLALPLMGSCSTETEQSSPHRLGMFEASLLATSANHVKYKLRDATFHLSGTTTRDIFSEDYADTQAVRVALEAGPYSIELKTGWRMERESSSGSFEPVNAILLSPSSQSFSITEQETTTVQFRFKAGDDVFEVGKGGLVVDIGIDDSGAGGSAGEAGLLLHVTFDDATAVQTPAVGPAGTLLAQPVFAPGRQGAGLLMTGLADGGRVSYPASLIAGQRGTIEFSARLVTPPAVIPWGGSPSFFSACCGYTVQFNGNDGWYGGGLVGNAGDGSQATGCYADSFTYSSILGSTGVEAWHHYALVWDEAGLATTGEKMQVFLDGNPVGTFSVCGQNHRPLTLAPAAGDIIVGTLHEGYRTAGGGAVMDELRIWDRAKLPPFTE